MCCIGDKEQAPVPDRILRHVYNCIVIFYVVSFICPFIIDIFQGAAQVTLESGAIVEVSAADRRQAYCVVCIAVVCIVICFIYILYFTWSRAPQDCVGKSGGTIVLLIWFVINNVCNNLHQYVFAYDHTHTFHYFIHVLLV